MFGNTALFNIRIWNTASQKKKGQFSLALRQLTFRNKLRCSTDVHDYAILARSINNRSSVE